MASKRSREIMLVAVIHIVLALAISFPLMLHPNSAIPYAHRVDPGWETVRMQQGDHLQFYYTLSLFGEYVRNRTSPLFSDPYMFRSAETEKYFSPRELPLSLVFFLLSFLGNAAAYNLLTVLSFLACGLGMFLLAGRYVGGFGARLFASVLFAVFPFRLAQLFGGHPNGFLVFLIPFMIYGYERWFDENRLKYLLLSGVCLLAMTMEELHLGYFSALFTAAFVPYKGICMFRGENRDDIAGTVKKFLGASIGILITWMLAGGYIAYLRNVVFKIAEVAEGRELWEIGIYAPRLIDFLKRSSADAEKVIYPGVVGIIAAAFVYIKKGGEDRFPGRKGLALWFYTFMMFITAVLSLGPNLRGVPLYSFFYNYVPFFHYPRSTARIFVFTMVALCVLGAYGVEKLAGMVKNKPVKRLLAPVLIVLLLLDFQSFRSIGVCGLSRGNKVYEHVKSQDDAGFILEVPLWPGDSSWSSVYLYYNTIYRLPIVNGYSPFVAREYIEGIFWPLASVNMGVLNRGQYERLNELGVIYIILHEEAYPSRVSPFPFRLAVNNMKNNPFVEFVKEDGSLYLFKLKEEVKDSHEVVYSLSSRMGVFYEGEHLYSQMANVKVDEEASGGLARFAEGEKKGLEFVLFGPYQLFPPGEYRVVYRLKGEEIAPGEVFAILEVTGDTGATVFAEKTLMGEEVLPGEYADYELEFSIGELSVLEFRLRWFGSGKIWADYVYLTFRDEHDPVYRYRTSEMFNSRGDTAYGIKSIHPPHNIAEGGARRYEAGDYAALFRMKTAEITADEIAVLRVLHTGTRALLAEKSVTGKLFNRAMEFKDIKVPFSLKKQSVLSFEVFFTKRADIWAEKIKILPREKTGTPDVRGVAFDAGKVRPGILQFRYANPGFAGTAEQSVVGLPSAYSPEGGRHGPSSYVWAGYFEAEEGEHVVGILSSDSALLLIDGEEVVNTGALHSGSYNETKIRLPAGWRRIIVRHVAGEAEGIFRLYWKRPYMNSPVPLPVKKRFFSHMPGDEPR